MALSIQRPLPSIEILMLASLRTLVNVVLVMIGVKDLRASVVFNGLFKCFNAKVSLYGV